MKSILIVSFILIVLIIRSECAGPAHTCFDGSEPTGNCVNDVCDAPGTSRHGFPCTGNGVSKKTNGIEINFKIKQISINKKCNKCCCDPGPPATCHGCGGTTPQYPFYGNKAGTDGDTCSSDYQVNNS